MMLSSLMADRLWVVAFSIWKVIIINEMHLHRQEGEKRLFVGTNLIPRSVRRCLYVSASQEARFGDDFSDDTHGFGGFGFRAFITIRYHLSVTTTLEQINPPPTGL